MREVIYTKRYYLEREAERLKEETESQWPSTPEEKRQDAEFEALMRQFAKEAEFVEIPGAAEMVTEVIETAKQLSEVCQVDMDIVRHETHVSVTLHLFHASFGKEFTVPFTWLLSRCLEIRFYRDDMNPCDASILLIFRTHRLCLPGES